MEELQWCSACPREAGTLETAKHFLSQSFVRVAGILC